MNEWTELMEKWESHVASFFGYHVDIAFSF